MRLTQLFTKTTKTTPADEVSKNAILLTQAGYIHKEMAGVYTFLPLGLKVLDNICTVVREEMDAIGGQELKLTTLQDAELWKATGRWDDEAVDVWFKTRLKNDTELGLGPTHEEPMVRALKPFVSSYRDLPFLTYQIQTKFRNETRAKSGVMRGREFLMKDMYSFARTQEEHDELYEQIKQAYYKVFARLGIGEQTFLTFASGGMFSQYSHEFQTVTDAGEDTIIQTSDGTWWNQEIAPSRISKPNASEEAAEYKEMELESVIGVQALIKALDIPIEKSTKTLIYTTDTGEHIIAAVRSDYSINQLKLTNIIGCQRLTLATEAVVRELTSAEIGYAGLVHLPKGVGVFMDDSLEGLCNFETGTNKTHYHSINVNFGRDVDIPEKFYDFKESKKGDLDPATDKPLHFAKAAEVGNIFTLKDKFSKPLKLNFTDEQGEERAVLMGCYGIGPSRLVGVITELLSDSKGLVWPVNIAPAVVYLARLGDESHVVEAADKVYSDLQSRGITVLYDDRDARPGEKFADADLMGIPYRVVVSAKTVAANVFEVKARTAAEAQMLTQSELLAVLTSAKTDNYLQQDMQVEKKEN